MRIILLVVVSFVLQPILAQRPFAPIGAQWKYLGWVDSGDCVQRPQITFSVKRDTVILGHYCTVIESDSADYLVILDNAGDVSFYHDSAFYDLYDFNAQVGDTMVTHLPPNKASVSWPYWLSDDTLGGPYHFLVDSIDLIDADGTVLKKMYTTSLSMEECAIELGPVIESVGPSYGAVFGTPCAIIADGCFGEFVCYTDSTLLYTGEQFESCGFTTATSNLTRHESLAIYPNPTSGMLFLDHIEQQEIESVSVWNPNGERLKLPDRSTSFDLTGHVSGVYFIIVTMTSGKNLMGRVVVL